MRTIKKETREKYSKLCRERFTTHNMSYTSEYRTWDSMKGRCYNPNNIGYSNYGGRGIVVCERWLGTSPGEGFQNFLEDMGYKPSSKHSIDRIDVNGNYEPSNCRWVMQEEQNRNNRRVINITYKDKTQCLTQWSRELGLSVHCLIYRIKAGWDIDSAFSTPQGSYRRSGMFSKQII